MTVHFTVKNDSQGGSFPITMQNVTAAGTGGVVIPLDAPQLNTLEVLPQGKKDPVVTWPTASAITYGATLESAFTGGSAVDPVTSAAVAGTFAVANGSSTPNAGTASTTVTFTPTDTTNYNAATSSSIDVTVNNADQNAPSLAIQANTPNSITITPVAGAVYGLKLKTDASPVTYGASNVFNGLAS